MGRLLVLRPEPQASAMVAALAARGVEAEAAPMLDIVGVADPVARVRAADAGADGLIFTSAQAARLIAADDHRADLLALPVFAVGAATAAAARAAGFLSVSSSDGDAAALVAALAASGSPGLQLPGLQLPGVFHGDETVARDGERWLAAIDTHVGLARDNVVRLLADREAKA